MEVIQLIHKICRRMEAHPALPEVRGAAEAAVPGTAPRGNHMLEYKVTGRIRQLIDILDKLSCRCPAGLPVPAAGNAFYSRGIFIISVSQAVDQFKKSIFTFRQHYIINFLEMAEEMVPEISGTHSAENYLNPGVYFPGHPGNFQTAPSIGMQYGKADNIRFPVPEDLLNPAGFLLFAMEIEDFHLMIAGKKGSSYVVKAYRGHPDIMITGTFFQAIGINQQNFHIISLPKLVTDQV